MLAAAFKLRCGSLPGLVRHTAVGTCQPVSLAQAAWHRWLASNVEALRAPAGQISANLKESRGVLRLHGEDIHQFLNVSTCSAMPGPVADVTRTHAQIV